MKDLLLPLLHLAVTAAKLCRPGGVRAVIAENLLLKLIVLRRSRQRAPNLRVGDRLLCGFGALFLSPGRIRKVAIGLRPSTLLTFHQALCAASTADCFPQARDRRSRAQRGRARRSSAPSSSSNRAILDSGARGLRIISQTFGVDIDKNVVHRGAGETLSSSPGRNRALVVVVRRHTTDSLWSVDLLRCASIVLQRDWVRVVPRRQPKDALPLCRA